MYRGTDDSRFLNVVMWVEHNINGMFPSTWHVWLQVEKGAEFERCDEKEGGKNVSLKTRITRLLCSKMTTAEQRLRTVRRVAIKTHAFLETGSR